MECVNFFPPRITRMLTKFAVLIAFESFARFVHSTNRIVPSGSLSAKFDRFERFVLKKHRASLIAFDKLERFVVTTQVVIERQCTARCLRACGSENFRGLYSIKLRIFGFHFRGATRCKQRAVHCLSMKIHLSSYHFG